MTRVVLVAVVAVASIGISITLWISNRQQAPSAPGANFLETPRDYPTTGGQEMQPRWKASEGAADAAAN